MRGGGESYRSRRNSSTTMRFCGELGGRAVDGSTKEGRWQPSPTARPREFSVGPFFSQRRAAEKILKRRELFALMMTGAPVSDGHLQTFTPSLNGDIIQSGETRRFIPRCRRSDPGSSRAPP